MLACNAEEINTILRGVVRFCGLDAKKVFPEYKWKSLWTEPAFKLLLLLLLCRRFVVFCQTLSATDTNSCLLLLLCRRFVVFCQTLSAADTTSCLSSQPARCPHHTLELFALFMLLHFHHRNTTLISAAVLMLPALLDRSYSFVSAMLPRSHWRDFVVSVFCGLNSHFTWLFFLSKVTWVLITYCCQHLLSNFFCR